MIKEVSNNIYQCEIPLPENPLKILNSYMIIDKNEALIIDTGFNHPASKEVFFRCVETLGINLRKTRVLITHLHADHSGLTYDLYQRGCEILMSEGDGNATLNLLKESTWRKLKEQMKSYGIDVENDFFDEHPGKKYAPAGDFPFTKVKEGGILEIGPYRLKVIFVPGHTPDMINLYDEKYQIYFSADHVLASITPNIGYWGPEHPGVLKQYIDSLNKILPLRVNEMYPSHRVIIKDHKKRIHELKKHHRRRLNEVKSIILQGTVEMTIEEIAAGMSWKIPFDSWKDFPPAQKAFALGEAMSHVEYLIENKEIRHWSHIDDVLVKQESE